MNIKFTKCRKAARTLLSLAILLISFSSVSAQQKQAYSGKISSYSDGKPLAGVVVQMKDGTGGVVSETDGTFSLNAEAGDVLTVTYMGFIPQEIKLANRTFLTISLRDNVEALGDVVVIGYGTTTQKEITGSVVSIKSDDFNKGTFTNAAGLLQGKVAGLSITNSSGGDPDAKYEILLRGNSTLTSGREPLIIIDGVTGGDLRNININEVESFDILKDGSAAAIYGTKGTNGVIIVTTKRARAGTTKVEYDGQVSIQSVARRAEPMSASEFEWTIKKFVPGSVNSLYGHNTNWFDEITRTPVSHKHSFTVSGGSDKFSHRTTLNVEQNQGIQLRNNSNKYLFKTNISQKAFEGWLDIDYNAYISKRKYNPANRDAFRHAFEHNPTEPIYDPTNKASGGYFTLNQMDYYNPVAMINERSSESETDNVGISARASLNILPVKGLKWVNFLSYGQEQYDNRTYHTDYYPSRIGLKGEAGINNSYSNKIQWESTINYARSFNLHHLQAVAGYSFEESTMRSSDMSNEGFDTDLWGPNNIGVGTALNEGKASMSSYKESSKYVAFFGRAMYNYDGKYLASVSLRRDGSSKFGTNYKWGWFPAVSLGWRINSENFMKSADWINDLKLRIGYGVTGNQDFANYQSLLLMKTNGHFLNNGKWTNVYSPGSNPNPDLRWEKKMEWNVGVDFSLFNNRLSGTVDYYIRNTKDLLYTYAVPTPPHLVNIMFTNVAKIRNQGIEVTLSGTPVVNDNFKWTSTLTFSRNTNKLIKLSNEEYKAGETPSGWLNTPMGVYCQRIIEGRSLGAFYAPVWEGIDSNGDDILKNSVGGSVGEDKWEYIGTAYPDFVLGWSNTLAYKKWDLSMSMRASIGGKAFNSYAANYQNIKSIGLRNILASWLDNTNFTGKPIYSSKYIEDTTYFKLDNIALGYNIAFNSKYISKMRLSFTAQNILCITDYSGVDPEVSLSGLQPGIEGINYYPRTAIFTFGVNITF